MKRLLLFSLALLQLVFAWSQSSDFKFKFYGRIRADLFYNSRANYETVDGLFYIYPYDRKPDADGNDLNARAQGGLYMLYTRLGVDIAGTNVGSAKATAKVEIDFRGSGTSFAMPRIRHAYVNLDWGRQQVLVGQTWHPMFGDVLPSMLNLSTGAPFQPLSRAPMIRYRQKMGSGLQLTGAAIWQLQFNSMGPNGKSHEYLKNSCIPELFLGLDYSQGRFLAGVGAELLSLKPRTSSTVDGITYKVNERITSISAEAHLRYKADMWTASAKTVLANNMTQTLTLGGFAATEIDPRTGEMKYAPFRHSMTWLNFVYGKKWQPGVFVGYLKNLGTGKSITDKQWGVGLDVAQLFSTNWQLSYNLTHWKLGVEFEPTVAWYGTMDRSNGKIRDTHSVTNFRVLGVMMYMF